MTAVMKEKQLRELDALAAQRVLELPAYLVHVDPEPRMIEGSLVRAVDRYTQDTAAAFDLLEYLIEKRYTPRIQHQPHVDPQKWEVWIDLASGFPDNGWPGRGHAMEPSLPLAITKAALGVTGWRA